MTNIQAKIEHRLEIKKTTYLDKYEKGTVSFRNYMLSFLVVFTLIAGMLFIV